VRNPKAKSIAKIRDFQRLKSPANIAEKQQEVYPIATENLQKNFCDECIRSSTYIREGSSRIEHKRKHASTETHMGA
jgi:hypothetical protein